MKKVIALILSVLLLVAGLPFAAFAADYTAGAVQELDGKYYSLGNVLYQNNFDGETTDTMPEGWQAGRPSYGWVGYGGSAAATVKETTGGKRLWVAIGSVDGFVSTPVINTRNYMFEADLTMSDGYMGIVNNMAGGVEASTTCIISRVFDSAATGTNETYHKGAVSITKTAFTIPSGNPVKGEAVKVKLISFEGTSYLYFNGDLVNTYSNVLSNNTTDCVGFYGCNSWYGVDNVKITALNVEEAPIVGFDYADVLNVEIGEKIFRHDYSEMASLPAEHTFTNVTLNTYSAVNGKKALALDRWWGGSSSTVIYNVTSSNYAAKLTMVLDNVQTDVNLGGYLKISTMGKNASGADAEAAYVIVGYPDRTAGAPYGGGVNISNEAAQYGFTTINGVTPFAKESGIETFTIYVYCYNGVNYYTKEDGTLIGTSAHNSAVTVGNTNTIKLYSEYGIAYVTDFEVFSISKKQPNSHLYVDALEQTTGFVRGEELVGVDFVDSAAGTTPDGWTLTSSSIGAGSDKTAGRNVLRIANDWGASKTTIPVSKSNFVAVATIGMDYAKKLNGTFWFGVSDTSDVIAAQWGLGLPKRSEAQTLKAGKSTVTNTVGYAYPAAGDYEFSTEGYTTVKMIIYSYNGQLHCYWADGTFVYSIAMNEAANINGGACKIHFANDYGVAYVHDIFVYELETPTLDIVEIAGVNAVKVAEDVKDNASYKVDVVMNATEAANVGFFTADADNANSIGYVEGENTSIISVEAGDAAAQTFITVDKKGGKDDAIGADLYMYVIDGDVATLNVTEATATMLTDVTGENALVANGGVSILEGVAENKSQAMRYYFAYDTTTGSDIVIDGETYTVKSRGFLVANGNVNGGAQITRSSANGTAIKDFNSTNLNKCWDAKANGDALNSTELTYSMYVTGFKAVNGTYNNTNRLYVKGYIVVEIDGVEYTLYGAETNVTVSEVAAVN